MQSAMPSPAAETATSPAREVTEGRRSLNLEALRREANKAAKNQMLGCSRRYRTRLEVGDHELSRRPHRCGRLPSSRGPTQFEPPRRRLFCSDWLAVSSSSCLHRGENAGGTRTARPAPSVDDCNSPRRSGQSFLAGVVARIGELPPNPKRKREPNTIPRSRCPRHQMAARFVM